MEEVRLEKLKSEFQKLVNQIDQLLNRNEILQEMLDLGKDFVRTTGQIDVLLKIGVRAQVTSDHRDFSLFQMPLFLWIATWK